MAEVDQLRSGEMMQAVLRVLADGGQMSGQKVIDAARIILPPTEYELGEYESRPGVPRYDTVIRFKTIGPTKAGWITKGRAGWQITADGLEALSTFNDPRELAVQSHLAYKRWKAERPVEDAVVTDDTVDDDGVDDEAVSAAAALEAAEETAWADIESHIRRMPPYQLQDLVGALMKAMGYHVPWVAPPGKDGGIDIVAYMDPLGATGPRIKVQVKRHNHGSIGAADLRSFLAVLGQHDVGIFVATNGFSSDAHKEARSQESRRIMLIDLERLVALWIEHYEHLSDDDQAMFPIRPVYFLASPA